MSVRLFCRLIPYECSHESPSARPAKNLIHIYMIPVQDKVLPVILHSQPFTSAKRRVVMSRGNYCCQATIASKYGCPALGTLRVGYDYVNTKNNTINQLNSPTQIANYCKQFLQGKNLFYNCDFYLADLSFVS